MLTLITKVLLTALALFCAAYVVPGVAVTGLYQAIIAAVILGILNVFIRPILVVLTLPITVVTLGLFMFVINALLFMFVASFVEGLSVDGFWAALFGSLVVSIISSLGNRFIKAA